MATHNPSTSRSRRTDKRRTFENLFLSNYVADSATLWGLTHVRAIFLRVVHVLCHNCTPIVHHQHATTKARRVIYHRLLHRRMRRHLNTCEGHACKCQHTCASTSCVDSATTTKLTLLLPWHDGCVCGCPLFRASWEALKRGLIVQSMKGRGGGGSKFDRFLVGCWRPPLPLLCVAGCVQHKKK